MFAFNQLLKLDFGTCMFQIILESNHHDEDKLPRVLGLNLHSFRY